MLIECKIIEMIEIPEKEATGKVAKIYDDIRETLDMSMVNTIWRNLALKEEVLEWVWVSLKPIYQNGSVRHYASKLRSQIDLNSIFQVPRSAFRVLGITDQDREALNNLLDDLAYSNAQNIIAFKSLLHVPSLEKEIEEFKKEHKKRDRYDLPPPINYEDLSCDEKEMFDEIKSIGGSVSVGFPPMWLRGLARYPSIMPLAWAILTQINSNGHLEMMKKATRLGSDEYASVLAGHIKKTSQPDTAKEAIARLVKLCDAIPRAMPVSLALNKAFSVK